MRGVTTKETELQELNERVWNFWKYCLSIYGKSEALFSDLQKYGFYKSEQLLKSDLLNFQFSLSYAISQFFDELEIAIEVERL